MPQAKLETFHVPNGAGWDICLKRCVDPERYNYELRPLLIVPGYGMNSFIFGYHPRGHSMMEHLAWCGFEVWTADFRNQGEARRNGGDESYHIEDIACTDLPVAIREVLANSMTGADRVDAVGCSLGGTYVFSYLACEPDHKLASVTAVGAPLRWDEVHPLLSVAFKSPWLVSKVPMFGIRPLASVAFPLLARVPGLLNIYLHTSHVDVSKHRELVRTVEDPNRWLNEDIAHWINERDLVVRGVNVTKAMEDIDLPLLVVLANADGIVPVETAMSCYRSFGSKEKEVLKVGTEELRFAHADLFVSDHAQELVFDPMAEWLLDR